MSSSSNKPRGQFPGLEFFTTLSKIAKTATEEIKQINRELTQPSAAQDLEDDSLWSELHLEYNKAYNQSIGLQQSLSNQQPISNSLESFYSMINWIKIETQRIEKQLQQFGYKPPDDQQQYEYDLPLTPQQQQIYDQQQQQQQKLQNQAAQIKQNQANNNNDHHNQQSNKMEIEQSTTDNPKDQNHDKMEVDNEESTELNYESDDIDLKKNQESDKKQENISTKSMSSTSHSQQNKNNKAADTNNSAQITPTNIIRKPPQSIIPGTPRTPALDNKFKLFFKNIREKNKQNDLSTKPDANNKENENKMNIMSTKSKKNSIDSNVSSISTITPSVSTISSVIPKQAFSKNKDILTTPVLDTKFDMNALRKKCGMPIPKNSNHGNMNQNESNLNDSLGSIPRLLSPKVSLKQQQRKNNNNLNVEHNHNHQQQRKKNIFSPITAHKIKATPQNLSNNKQESRIHKTPITVSSFSVRQNDGKCHDSMDDDDDDDLEDGGDGDGDMKGMGYITKSEFDGIPSWITSQLGTIEEINKNIDLVNNALKSWNGRISKSQFKDLIGKNETPFILLLTRTNRLQTDWSQGNSVYCLK